MTTYTITANQKALLDSIRLQLLDLGDSKTAALLDWAVTAEPIADDEVLVALKRGEGYEDVHPQLLAEDALGGEWPEWRLITTELPQPPEA